MRRRLLLSTVGIAVLVAVLLGVPTAVLLDRLAYATARSQAERQAVSVGLALEPALVTGRIPTPAFLGAVVGEQEQLTLVTPEGRVITGGTVEGSVLTVAAPGPAGTQIQLTTSDQDVRRELQRSWLALAAVALAGIAAAAVLAIAQSRRLSRPLERLRRQAERIGAGDFTATTPRTGLGEIDAIGAALDDTTTRIARLVEAERSFSTNASHQLRSALTGLVLRLDHLAENGDPAVRDEAVAALEQTDRLLATVEDLLRLARTGRAGEQRPVDLHTLATAHVEDWGSRFEAGGRDIVVSGHGPVPTRASPGGIGQAVDILLDNALVHGAGRVAVHVERTDDHGELVVSDEGAGPDADVDLFQRGAAADGHGLGLALARTLVESDGGSLDLVGHRPPAFRIRLPVAPADHDPGGTG
jgi:signal transduction histidine kinase